MHALLKYALVLAIGITLGYQFSKNDGVLSRIEVSALAKSEANQKLDEILAPQNLDNEQCIVQKQSPGFELKNNDQCEDLTSQSMHSLSKALDKKQKAFLKENISKFEKSADEEDLKAQKEDMYDKISLGVAASSNWTSQAELNGPIKQKFPIK